MNITELLITGHDGPRHLFALTLTANEAKVLTPGTGEEAKAVVGEAWEMATDAFPAVRNLMNDIVSAS